MMLVLLLSAINLGPHASHPRCGSSFCELLVNGTTVWQSNGHCLIFSCQRFELTANGSRSIE